MNYQIDHIDPRWKEGRDYQLVCGLDVPLNFEEREESVNKSKNNRFLPWRVAKEEIGSMPVNPGDLCLFLVGADIEKDIPGEWVLMEFMRKEWYFHTKSNCGSSFPGKRRNTEASRLMGLRHAKDKTGVCGRSPEKMSEDGRLGGLIQGPKARDEKTGIHDPANKDICREGSKKAGKKNGPVQGPRSYEFKTGIFDPKKAANNRKFMCLESGNISTPGPLTMYQKARGIDPSRRVELTPEEKAFIFLWDN
jgi:hypothetical protein